MRGWVFCQGAFGVWGTESEVVKERGGLVKGECYATKFALAHSHASPCRRVAYGIGVR